MDPPAGEHRDFDAWYQDDHVPARMVLPGFRGAVRAWAVHGGPVHLVVYFMDSLDTLRTPVYETLKRDPSPMTKHMLASVRSFTRWPGEPVADTGPAAPGRYVEVAAFELAADELEAFDAWHRDSHVPALMRDPAVLRCRSYAIAPGGDPATVNRVVLHESSSSAPFSGDPMFEPAGFAPAWGRSCRRAVYERHQDFDARR
jgi:hypothetical protein